MTNTVTTLLEKAMGSDSDAERLACLNQAKRLYRNEGIALPRRVVREQTTVPASATPMITLKEHQAKVDELERDRVRLIKDNSALSAENAELKKKLLDEGTRMDAELIEQNNKLKRKNAFLVLAALPLVAAIVVVALVAL